ncbi:MAG: 1-deoxy-D-xylulose-5-phosphate reductoisomerase [Desulfobulbaceae bacterium]|nr:1-deoxy-D-xylulose-5-phosphate reductoisomerase [Desulfobulbaceae bacterium]HIJ78196.1 1-deoxy-D-xylulose-5-phosphate reductoisomerase [Deltaproteobacteria bacterium]
MKNISLLGSTGSIGCNVLDVVRQFPGRFRIVGLAAGNNGALLREQIEAFNPQKVSIADAKLAGDLAQSLPPGWSDKIEVGTKGNISVATIPEADTVVSAIVGAAGLTPTLAAIEAGKNIALANKETLVMAGNLVMDAVKRCRVTMLPIDSEHNAIFQALEAGRREDVNKILLTASGGPFQNKSMRELWDVSPEQALAHPNWTMGKKISIDSATLMNKGLEVIEAKWLFDIEVEAIEVLIHPQSIVHSMVEYKDGSVISQMGIPDMRIPIAYALSYPERLRLKLPRLDLFNTHDLSFHRPDFERFPALKLAYQVCKRGGTLPAVLNAANEVAVDAFLNRKIRFPEIALTVAETVNRLPGEAALTIKSVLDADLAARMQAESIIEAYNINSKQRLGEEILSPDLPPGLKS